MIMSEHSARLLWVALFGIVLSIGLSALTTVYLIIAITSGIITATPLDNTCACFVASSICYR